MAHGSKDAHTPSELGTGHIGTLLWRYALPSITAMVASSLYNIVDSIFVGQGVGDIGISGMTLTAPFMNLSSAFGAMVGMGSSTLISIKLGQGDYATAQKILGNTITLNILLGILFTAGCLPFLDQILHVFGASESTLPYARDYTLIILLGNVVTHSYFGLNNVLRSIGHPNKAMQCTFLTILANTMLDPLFIFVFGWGIQGAAIATILSQIISLLWQLVILSNSESIVHFRRGIYALDKIIVRQTLAIGLSPFLMNASACLVVLIINNRMVDYGGDMAIGAYGIVHRVVFLFVMVVVGLLQGMQPIVGYNWGACLNNRVQTALKYTMVAAVTIMTCGFLVGEFFPRPVIHIFGSSPELTEIAVRGFRFNVAAFPLAAIQMVITNFFQSIGHPGKSIFLSMTRQLLFLLPAVIVFPYYWGLDGVWFSIPISDGISTLTAIGMLLWLIKHLKTAK